MSALRESVGPLAFERGRFGDAIGLFERLVFTAEFEEFLTIPAYDHLLDLPAAGQA